MLLILDVPDFGAHRFGKMGQDANINSIGLGQSSGGFSKFALKLRKSYF